MSEPRVAVSSRFVERPSGAWYADGFTTGG